MEYLKTNLRQIKRGKKFLVIENEKITEWIKDNIDKVGYQYICYLSDNKNHLELFEPTQKVYAEFKSLRY